MRGRQRWRWRFVRAWVCVHPLHCGWGRADQWVETTTERYLWTTDLDGPQPTVSLRRTVNTYTHPHIHLHANHKKKNTLEVGRTYLKKAGRRCSFYLGHIFTSYFIISLPSCLLGSCSSVAPSLKECAFEIYRLSSFPFHLTRSLQPSMWMAKTCKRLEETKRAWVREAWRKRRTGEKISGGGGLLNVGLLTKQICSSLQGCNSLLCFLHPSIHCFIHPFLSCF